jgi:PmbA protein
MELRDVAQDLVARARRAGADAADAVVGDSDGLEVGIRLGEVEKLKRSRERRAGLRVFVNGATGDRVERRPVAGGLDTLVTDAIALARVTAPDTYGGLPDAADLATAFRICSSTTPRSRRSSRGPRSSAAARPRTRRAPRRTRSRTPRRRVRLRRRPGRARVEPRRRSARTARRAFRCRPCRSRRATARCSATTGTRRAAGSTASSPADAIGREAARRTLRRLGARRVPTGEYPIVFDPDVAASLVRHLAGAISGSSLYRRASFLLDSLGQTIAAPGVTIIDDPLRPGGLASRPFDGEGVASTRRTIVRAGRARELSPRHVFGAPPRAPDDGPCGRAAGDAPGVSPTNLYLEPGPHHARGIIGSVSKGST